jgi:hypothetical protein
MRNILTLTAVVLTALALMLGVLAPSAAVVGGTVVILGSPDTMNVLSCSDNRRLTICSSSERCQVGTVLAQCIQNLLDIGWKVESEQYRESQSTGNKAKNKVYIRFKK